MIKEKQVYLFANATILQEIMLYSSRLREINKEISNMINEREKIKAELENLKDIAKKFEEDIAKKFEEVYKDARNGN